MDPRLVRRARATRVFLVAGVAAGSATALLVVWQAWLLAHTIAPAVERGEITGLPLALGLLGLVLAGRAGLSWLTTWLAHRSAAAVKSQLRADIMTARLADPVTGTASAQLVTLVTQGLDALDGYFSKYLPQLVLAVTVPLIAGAAVLLADWRSAAVLAVTLPLIPLFMALVGWATEAQVRRRWRYQNRLASHFADLMSGLPTLQVFGRARAQAEGLRRTEQASRAETMRTLRISFLSALVMELLSTMAVAIVAVTIGTRLVYEGVDFTTALFVLVLAPEVYLPVRMVGVHYHDSADGVAAAESAFAEIERAARPLPQAAEGEGLVLSEVSHRYGTQLALAPVSLRVEPGEVVALAGPSGAGKTTLVLAVLGLLSPTSGRLSLDGQGLAETGLAAWRSRLAYVPQHPGMVAGDVAGNVRIGWSEASDEQVRQALERAGAPGLAPESAVSEDGEGLSAGERRRVAVARALLRIDHGARYLVLDEPTAGLDADAEAAVLASVRASGAGVLVVSHRPAVLAAADRVVQVDPPAGPGADEPGQSAASPADQPAIQSVGLPTDQSVLTAAEQRTDRPASALAEPQAGDGPAGVPGADVQADRAGSGLLGGQAGDEPAGVWGAELRTDRSGRGPDGPETEAEPAAVSPAGLRTDRSGWGAVGSDTAHGSAGVPGADVQADRAGSGSFGAQAGEGPAGVHPAGGHVLHLVRTLLAEVPGGRWRLALAVLLAAGASAASVALLGVSAWLISKASQHPPFLELSVAAVGVRFFGISRAVLRYLERLVGHDVALRMQSALRLRSYRTLARTTLLGRRRGDLLVRVVADVEAVQDVVVRVVLPFAAAVVVTCGTTVVLGRFSPASAAVLLVTAVLAGLVVPTWAQRASRAADQAAVPLRGELGNRVHEAVRAGVDLALYGAQRPYLDRIRDTDRRLRQAEQQATTVRATAAAAQVLAAGTAVLAALWIGGQAVAAGELGSRLLAVLVLTPLALHESLAGLAQAAQTLTRARAALARVVAVLAEPPVGQGDAPVQTSDTPRLAAARLSVGWPGMTPVAAPVDLDLRPGQAVAVVGPSGAGKTTLAATLLGLIPPLAGRLDRQGRIGYLAQDAHIFATSVAENVRIGSKDATDDQVRAALAGAGLALPLDRVVGELGATLSGGEARRLALARLLAGRYDLLVLDEPTEHLDPGTARALVDDIWAGLAARPVLVLTHDPEVVYRCHHVIRLEPA
ncbi:MAG: thiol reductant ABC exporter subunit CydD [Actinomycetia bacterium]|nr:thiol reductant ABC exporter subunit CydD [Actinomycetes bacterium]